VTVSRPETRYATNNGPYVAYQLTGDGPMDVVLLTQWFSNLDSQWDVPPLAEFIGRLAVRPRADVRQARLAADSPTDPDAPGPP
jgi:hypothetical protein